MLQADINRALQDINRLFAGFLLDTNISVSDDVVSWHGYKPGFYSNRIYGSEYQNLIDLRQYSFLLYDKSFYSSSLNGIKKNWLKQN